jgi:hypothetical protein
MKKLNIVGFRLTDAELAELVATAASNGRSVAGEIRFRLYNKNEQSKHRPGKRRMKK